MPLLNEDHLTLVDFESREVFEWGLQKVCNITKSLVTSFVTSEVLPNEFDVSDQKDKTLLSESPKASKVTSQV